MGNSIYFFRESDNSVYKYDLSTNQLTTNALSSAIDGVQGWSCWTGDDNYIYNIGGYYSNSFLFLNLTTNTWNYGSLCLTIRYVPSCEVSFNGKLYAIGGYGSSNFIEAIYTDNIEINSWFSLNDGFSISSYTTSAVYNIYIFVMGGGTDLMYIINTITDIVTLSSDRLPHSVQTGASVVMDNILYLFGNEIEPNDNWSNLLLLSVCFCFNFLQILLRY